MNKIYEELGVDRKTTERAMKGAKLLNKAMMLTAKASLTEHYQKKSLHQILKETYALNLR